MTDLKKFVIPEIKDPKGFRYLYGKKEFVPGKSWLYYSGPYWDENEIGSALKAFCYGKWLSSGENVHKFECEFSKRFGHKQSLMVNSGSSANLVMISALKKRFGWKDGDEIIVSCVGFPTTLAPIVQNNLKPVFVDISLDDLNWDTFQIEQKITNKTVALFSSPVLGNPYDFDHVKELCKKHKIQFVGDNCDSLGSQWRGKYLTDYYVVSSCSFYASHHICCGEGGMVSSNDMDLVTEARSFATWGRDCFCVGSANLLSCGTCGKRFSKWLNGYDEPVDHKYVFSNIGYNLKPLDFQGAIGLEQLKKFSEIKEKRKFNKYKIGNFINDIDGIKTIQEKFWSDTCWFGTPVICETKELKQKLVQYLETNKIQTRNYFAGNILLHPGYEHLGDYKKYPNASIVLDRVFFIGCSPQYGKEELEYIENVLNDFKFIRGNC